MLDSITTSSGQIFHFDLDRLREAYNKRFGYHPKLTNENQGLIDRINRALSWIERARSVPQGHDEGDLHGEFIALWVAFNALYGREEESRSKEAGNLESFLGKVVQIDGDDKLIAAVLNRCKRNAEGILKDEFLWPRYWSAKDSMAKIRSDLQSQLEDCYEAKGEIKIDNFLKILFKRLYFLRNMIFHGNTTDKNSPIKDSLRGAVEMLDSLLRAFVLVLVRKAEYGDWNPVPFPRKRSPQHPVH